MYPSTGTRAEKGRKKGRWEGRGGGGGKRGTYTCAKNQRKSSGCYNEGGRKGISLWNRFMVREGVTSLGESLEKERNPSSKGGKGRYKRTSAKGGG